MENIVRYAFVSNLHKESIALVLFAPTAERRMIMRKICKECANYDHKNLKHTKACGNCVTEHYKDGTESDPSNWRALPQTNADRIRAMSDEELARFLADKLENEYILSCKRLGDDTHMLTATEIKAIRHTCYCIWMQWLKQPAEGE
jgi:hypothetical protein